MTESERAKERFCASDAVNRGKSQCVSCVHFKDWACPVVDPQQFPTYLGNREKCPERKTAE